MKKAFLTLMAVFYLAIASGAGVHFHYCMGKLADWNLVHTQQRTCGICGMTKKADSKKSCCKDITHQAKVDTAKKTNAQIYKFEHGVFAILQPKPVDQYLFPVIANLATTAQSHAPPLLHEQPIFITNCTYRI